LDQENAKIPTGKAIAPIMPYGKGVSGVAGLPWFLKYLLSRMVRQDWSREGVIGSRFPYIRHAFRIPPESIVEDHSLFSSRNTKEERPPHGSKRLKTGIACQYCRPKEMKATAFAQVLLNSILVFLNDSDISLYRLSEEERPASELHPRRTGRRLEARGSFGLMDTQEDR
jgi:hypothetical protein